METLEGKQSVMAALDARQRRFDVILIRHDTHEEKVREVIELAAQHNVPVRRVDGRELDALTHGATHGGVVAIATEKPRMSVAAMLEMIDVLREPPLLLLLEGVDDARNLGFTLRTTEAVGAHAVLIKKHLWDFDSVEVSRPSSGAYERMPLVQIDDVTPLKQLQARGVKLLGCIANAKTSMYDADLRAGCVLAIGGEKRGLSGAVRAICDQLITIPMRGGVASSLSLSHAAAILLAEAMRQRMKLSAVSDQPSARNQADS